MRVASRVAKLAAALLAGMSTIGSVHADTIGNGLLVVDVRNDNGAISSVRFHGREFFALGTPVSDFMFQNAMYTGIFRLNSALGEEGVLVDVASTAGSITATGTFIYGGEMNVGFARVYSLVPDQNVLRVTTTLTNAGSEVKLRYADAVDPDQGTPISQGPATYNDVFDLSTSAGNRTVARATNGYSVTMGSLDTDAFVGFLDGSLRIADDTRLNKFFDAPLDPNGLFQDIGMAVGFQTTLAAGQTRAFVADYAFGIDAATAQGAFLAANPAAVPLPAPMVAGLVLMGMIHSSRRARQRA